MKKSITILLFILLGQQMFAQNEQTEGIINFDELSDKEIYSIQNDGWTLYSYHDKISLINFSNEDYILHFPVHCKNISEKPSFLIEFTNNYRDGHRGGLDFTSSKSDRFKRIDFIIDETTFENPFKNYDKDTFQDFRTALKGGKTLTIKFFDDNDSNKLSLNRGITFKLEGSKLLEVQVDCKE